MANININKDIHGFPFYTFSNCGEELETVDDYYCENCEEELDDNHETLTECTITFIKNQNNFSFCQLQKYMLYGDIIFPMITELEFYVFPKNFNLMKDKNFKINFKDFQTINIDGYSLYYNPENFSSQEISEIKTYRFS